jgi:hypothetical protein
MQPVRGNGLRTVEPVPRQVEIAEQRFDLRSLAVALLDL